MTGSHRWRSARRVNSDPRTCLQKGPLLKKPTERTLRLLRAAEQGHFHVAKLLLAGGADASAAGQHGETVLHCAAGNGQAGMVAFVLPLIGEVDVRDNASGTPLHWAARQNRTDVARFLLEHGADPKATDTQRLTPLHC